LAEKEHTLLQERSESLPGPVEAQPLQNRAAAWQTGLPAGFLTLLLTLAALMALVMGYLCSGVQVTLQVNGSEWHTKTHQRTVGAFLREVGLDLQPQDIVVPPLETPLEQRQAVVVQRALPVLLEADGQVVERRTHSQRVSDLLCEAGLSPKPYDVVTLDGKQVNPDEPLPRGSWTPNRWPLFHNYVRSSTNLPSAWIRLRLQRAVPLSINDDGAYATMHTVARTVGEALLSQDIVLYLGDHVQPLLGTLLTAGMHVEIHRAKPVSLQVDGKLVKTRTQASNVAQLLSEAGVVLSGRDYAVPKLDAEVIKGTSVRVVRVVDDWALEAEEIPYETVWHADDGLELDQQRTDQPGKAGVRKRNVHIVYEDSQETERTVVDEWVERQPTTRVVSFGTYITVRELQTSSGVVRYWRRIRMLATSYRASAVGKKPDHPEYGLTRLGWQARRGIVAVDPRVINLRSSVYVPGYGLGVAADTGGKILGRWIDLCYDEEDWVPWKQWVDVYVLEPVPPAAEINWIVPNYPTEGR